MVASLRLAVCNGNCRDKTRQDKTRQECAPRIQAEMIAEISSQPRNALFSTRDRAENEVRFENYWKPQGGTWLPRVRAL